MAIRGLSAALLFAAVAEARTWSPLTLEQELCWFSLAIDGYVNLRSATCCWGQVESAGLRCPGASDAASKFNYSTSTEDYSTDCDVYNPAAFIVAVSASDIRRAINFFRTRDIPFRIKSGGHQYNCESKCDGNCVVLSTSGMKSVEYVTAGNGDVYIGIEPGITLNEATIDYIANSNVFFPHGLCPAVGVGGNLLGGGAGYFIRKFGMGVDYVVGVEIVLASGNFVKVFDEGISTIIQGYEAPSNSKHQDLLWALRGNGHGNFGVVTKFWLKTIRRPEYLVFGQAAMALDSVEAAENFWASACAFYQSPQNETRGARNLQAWPTISGGEQYPFSPVTMSFSFFYTPDNNDTMLGALAEAQPVIAKFLESVKGNYTLALYPVPSSQMYVGLFSSIKPKPLYSCTARTIEKASDVCEFASWRAYFAEKMYTDAANVDATPTTFFVYFDPYHAALSENDPTFARSSFSPRHAWGLLTYCRVPISETQPARSVLNDMVNEVNDTLMANISSMTYSNAKMQSNNFRSAVYPYRFIYEKLQAVKLRYDPANLFSYALSVELPEQHQPATLPPFGKWW